MLTTKRAVLVLSLSFILFVRGTNRDDTPPSNPSRLHFEADDRQVRVTQSRAWACLLNWCCCCCTAYRYEYKPRRR